MKDTRETLNISWQIIFGIEDEIIDAKKKAAS